MKTVCCISTVHVNSKYSDCDMAMSWGMWLTHNHFSVTVCKYDYGVWKNLVSLG